MEMVEHRFDSRIEQLDCEPNNDQDCEREKPGSFRSEGIGRLTDQSEKEVEFIPFYRLHRRTYSIYWDLYNSDTWTKRLAEVAAENARSKQIDSSANLTSAGGLGRALISLS